MIPPISYRISFIKKSKDYENKKLLFPFVGELFDLFISSKIWLKDSLLFDLL
jgi:hypothetical protein